MDPQLRELADRIELTELIAREVDWLDGRGDDTIDRIFTEDATARTPGGEAHDRNELASIAKRSHAGFEATHHLPAGIVIDLDGDTAAARFSMYISLVEQGGTTLLHATGRYRVEARRTAEGWRTSRLEIDPGPLVRALTAP